MRIFFVLATVLFTQSVARDVFYYYIDSERGDDAVSSCVAEAVHFIEENTCLRFTEDTAPNELSFSVLHSGECAWQASNRTLHLSPHCSNLEMCTELVGKALSVNRPKHDILHFINEHHNCTSACSVHCLHGGSLQRDSCTCDCPYGFEGTRCEKLKREGQFNDDNCGVIQAEDQGSIALSTYPGDHPKAVFCQWLVESDDAWATIELSFDTHDMDKDSLSPNMKCNDILNVYGAGDPTTIPCDGSSIPSMRSKSNWVLVELRTNPYSTAEHAGPSIRYSLHSRNKGMMAYADEMTASTASATVSATVMAVIAARLL